MNQTKRKAYPGPYGNYVAGQMGAVLNALYDQGRPMWWIDQLVLGSGKLLKRSDESVVIGTFEWIDDEIIFDIK